MGRARAIRSPWVVSLVTRRSQRVVAVGKNVTDFKVGERVYPYPHYAATRLGRAPLVPSRSHLGTQREAKSLALYR